MTEKDRQRPTEEAEFAHLLQPNSLARANKLNATFSIGAKTPLLKRHRRLISRPDSNTPIVNRQKNAYIPALETASLNFSLDEIPRVRPQLARLNHPAGGMAAEKPHRP